MARVEASFATNLVGATPTEQVSCCSSKIRRADRRTDLGGPAEQPPGTGDIEERLVERERFDQRGHVPEDRMIAADAAAYSVKSGGRKIAAGHSRRARAPGIALRTPNTRAS